MIEGDLIRRAERMIRQKIDELTIDRYPYKKEFIKNAIEFSYWAGAISKRKMTKLNDLLLYKCDIVMNNYNESCRQKANEDYLRFRARYKLDE